MYEQNQNINKEIEIIKRNLTEMLKLTSTTAIEKKITRLTQEQFQQAEEESVDLNVGYL